MTVNEHQAVVPVDSQAALAAARAHNEALFTRGEAPELPGQGEWIPIRSCIGRSFLIRRVEFDTSQFRDGDEWARLTVVFEDSPEGEETVTAGGAYLMNQLHRLSDAELRGHLWTVHELLKLRGKTIDPFNGLYPLVLDYAHRPDPTVVEAGARL